MQKMVVFKSSTIFVLFLCGWHFPRQSGSVIIPSKIPSDFVGTWFLPDQQENLIEIEDHRILGGRLISEPFEFDELKWEFFANLTQTDESGQEKKECLKCFNLEILHKNVIRMNAGECLLVTAVTIIRFLTLPGFIFSVFISALFFFAPYLGKTIHPQHHLHHHRRERNPIRGPSPRLPVGRRCLPPRLSAPHHSKAAALGPLLLQVQVRGAP